jgi:cobalamin biosynthesis Mg chelatase CobN
MKNATISGNSTPTTNQPYSPSVPISLYREVMAELQTTQAHLNALKEENRELHQENQQLHQKIEQIINSVMHLQQVTGHAYQPMSSNAMPANMSQPVQMPPNTSQGSDRANQSVSPQPNSTQSNNKSESASVPFVSPFATGTPGGLSNDPEPLFTEQQEPRPRRVARSPKSSEVGGIWLFVSIFLIVVSAFGIGFFFIRPFIQQNQPGN